MLTTVCARISVVVNNLLVCVRGIILKRESEECARETKVLRAGSGVVLFRSRSRVVN